MGLFLATGGMKTIIFMLIIGLITITSIIMLLKILIKWGFYQFFKKDKQKTDKPFYKKPVLMLFFTITTVFWTPIIYDKYYTYYSTPKEHRWYFKPMKPYDRMEDMMDNPEKYQKLPCLEVQAGKDKYCFDRSKIRNIVMYNKPQSTEFAHLRFDFISKLLPKPIKTKNKYSLEGRRYLLGNIHISAFDENRNYKNTSTMAKEALIKWSKENNKTYKNFIQEYNNT
jgi:hypothetical protein